MWREIVVGQLHLWLILIYLTKLKLPLIIKLCVLSSFAFFTLELSDHVKCHVTVLLKLSKLTNWRQNLHELVNKWASMEIYVIYLSCTFGMIFLDFVFCNLYMEANYLACPLDRGILIFSVNSNWRRPHYQMFYISWKLRAYLAISVNYILKTSSPWEDGVKRVLSSLPAVAVAAATAANARKANVSPWM